MNSPRIFSQFKICPRCGTRSGVNALTCLHCGRKYKGQLPISPLPGNARPTASPADKNASATTRPLQRRTLNITNFYQLKRSGIASITMVGLVIAAIVCSIPFFFHVRLHNMAEDASQPPSIYVIADPATERYWPATSTVFKNPPRGYIVMSMRLAARRGYHRAPEPE